MDKHLLWMACALVLIGLAAVLPASAAAPVSSIDVEKYVSVDGGTTWLDADTAPGPELAQGGPAPQFMFNITNTGDANLREIVLSDNVLGPITLPATTLSVGAQMSVTRTGTWAAGQHTNTANVTGLKGSTPHSDTDVAHYFGVVPVQAPTAAFSGTPISGDAPLSVQFTDASTGSAISAWSWTFGDGATSTEQNPSHTYSAAGTYSVNLTVTNAGGSDDELKTDYITVNEPAVPPVANFSATPLSGEAPLEVTFTDLSTGAPTAWAWDFDNDGDVDSNVQNPTYTYNTAGTYTVNLTVTNADGSDSEVKTDYITVNEPAVLPVAAFSGTPVTGDAPLEVTFTDASTGAPTSWSWDFDNDGDVDSTAQNPTYTYSTAGTYTVNLTVTNADGSDSEVKTNYITVNEPVVIPGAPTADFSGAPTSGDAPLTVGFTDLSTGDAITNWSWTFGDMGDEIGSTEQNPVHTYTAAGTYTVRLEVTNASGSNAVEKVGYIIVTEPVVPGAPMAAFSANVTSGNAPLAVQFTDASTGIDIEAWSWTFGDGATSTEQNPVHIYAAAGTYTVNLTVTNATGSDDDLKTGYITVSGAVGSQRGYFLVSTEPAGADIYLEYLGGERILQGNTSAGPLNVTICLPCVPVKKIIATLEGYQDAVYTVIQDPAEGATVPVHLVLVQAETPGPFPTPHIPWVLIQAEDFDAGGEGVAYHDVEPANLGGVYRNEGVDIETEDGVTDVGWIRDGEFLRYSVDTTIAGNFYLTLRAANPDTITKAVTVYLDGTPVGEAMVGPTGAWTSYAEFSMPTPMVMTTGRHVITLAFEGTSRINLDWLRIAAGIIPTVTTPTPTGASFMAAPVAAPHGDAVKFTLTPAAGKTVKAVWWSFDAPAHLQTWNSRNVNPTFFYPRAGTFSPLVRITYTDNTVEEVQRINYIQAT